MMQQKKTLVLGASLKPDRFSNRAVRRLTEHGIQVVAMGLRVGEIAGIRVETPYTLFTGIHTISLYIGPRNLFHYHEYILSMKPYRVIFNPGTEDRAFMRRLALEGIEVVEDCTLVMISSGRY